MHARAVILLFGPVLLMAASYVAVFGLSDSQARESFRGNDPARTADAATATAFDPDALRRGAESGLPAARPEASRDSRSGRLDVLCDEAAARLARHLTPQDHLIVRPPFVLAGDLSTPELDRVWRETVVPTAQALARTFFDRAPDEPVLILLYSNDESYRSAARRFDRRGTADYHGYYLRGERRIVLNLATGAGTLAHELTHALAHFDNPHLPEWFDEGLASLFEEADFTADGLQLRGVSNWRLNHLLHALQHGQLSPLEALIAARRIDSRRQAVDYAHARYFCLYLQERDLLPAFYRKLKARHDSGSNDPSGLSTLCDLLGTESLDPVDRDFRQWAIALYESIRHPAPAPRSGN